MFKKLIITVGLLVSFMVAPAYAKTNKEIIYDSVVESVKILEDQYDPQFEDFEELVNETFDVKSMVPSIVGPYWRTLTESQKAKLSEQVLRFTFNRYINMVRRMELTSEYIDEIYDDIEITERLIWNDRGIELKTKFKNADVRVYINAVSKKVIDIRYEGISFLGYIRGEVRAMIDQEQRDFNRLSDRFDRRNHG